MHAYGCPYPEGCTCGYGSDDPPKRWILCRDRMPPDFVRVLVYGVELGFQVASRSEGEWRIETPLRQDGKKVILTGCYPPSQWTDIPSIRL